MCAARCSRQWCRASRSAGRPITDLLIEPAAAARRLREQLDVDGIATCSTRIAGIGIDVGGTFTDFVLADRNTGQLVRYKEQSVPADPSLSVKRGLPALIERAGVAPSEIELVVHGTTLALNAIIQRRGAKLGLVVSRGNRRVGDRSRSCQMHSVFCCRG